MISGWWKKKNDKWYMIEKWMKSDTSKIQNLYQTLCISIDRIDFLQPMKPLQNKIYKQIHRNNKHIDQNIWNILRRSMNLYIEKSEIVHRKIWKCTPKNMKHNIIKSTVKNIKLHSKISKQTYICWSSIYIYIWCNGIFYLLYI